MDDKYWDPVNAYCEKHELPIIVHGTNCTDPRLKTIPHNERIGFVWKRVPTTQLLRSSSQRCGTAFASSRGSGGTCRVVHRGDRSIAPTRASLI
jgi:hypothetical protein